MARVDSTYRDLRALASAFPQLKAEFASVVGSLELLARPQSELVGLTLEPHSDLGYFRIKFCEREFEFRFSVLLHSDGAPRGRVSCFTALPEEPTKSVLLKAFTFKRNGDIDEPPPEDGGDHPNTGDGYSGTYFVGACILEACKK